MNDRQRIASLQIPLEEMLRNGIAGVSFAGVGFPLVDPDSIPKPKRFPVKVPVRKPRRIGPLPPSDPSTAVEISETSQERFEVEATKKAVDQALAQVIGKGEAEVARVRADIDRVNATRKKIGEREGPPCDCPAQVDRAGRVCGGRAAKRRPGGRSPKCEGDPVDFGDSLGGEEAKAVRAAVRAVDLGKGRADQVAVKMVKRVKVLEDLVLEAKRLRDDPLLPTLDKIERLKDLKMRIDRQAKASRRERL